MDHSVQAYLKRTSTQKLEEFLQNDRNALHAEDFSGIIDSIIQELQRRKEESAIKASRK